LNRVAGSQAQSHFSACARDRLTAICGHWPIASLLDVTGRSRPRAECSMSAPDEEPRIPPVPSPSGVGAHQAGVTARQIRKRRPRGAFCVSGTPRQEIKRGPNVPRHSAPVLPLRALDQPLFQFRPALSACPAGCKDYVAGTVPSFTSHSFSTAGEAALA